jgi:hypothetical protein
MFRGLVQIKGLLLLMFYSVTNLVGCHFANLVDRDDCAKRHSTLVIMDVSLMLNSIAAFTIKFNIANAVTSSNETSYVHYMSSSCGFCAQVEM